MLLREQADAHARESLAASSGSLSLQQGFSGADGFTFCLAHRYHSPKLWTSSLREDWSVKWSVGARLEAISTQQVALLEACPGTAA